jgi:alpha-tubulin suppressor-like RCC1 family protein
MCWGYDYNGEVGQGTPGTGSTTPALVVGGLKFTQLATGHGSSCAVTATGDAYCWGAGLWGERGDGTFAPQAASPQKVVTP